jgi:hypothetical protein
MPTIKIEGVTYDVSTQPCEIAAALRVIRTKRAMGQQLVETEIRSPVSQKRLRLKEVPPAELNDEIAYYDGLCAAKTGGKPNRYRKTMRFC